MHAIRNLTRIAFGTRARALVAARLRPDVVHVDGPGHAAQPVRVQGRHREPQGRGDRRRRASTSGSSRATTPAPGWLAGGVVPRRPPDPDDDRDLGPHVAARAGGDHRPRPRARARRCRAAPSSPSPTSPRPAPTAQPLIAADSHVRLAHPSHNGGARMLRRGYNFTDGNDSLGRLDAGLFFVAFVRDPRTGFIPIQDALARERRAERVPPAHRLGPVRGAGRRARDRRRRDARRRRVHRLRAVRLSRRRPSAGGRPVDGQPVSRRSGGSPSGVWPGRAGKTRSGLTRASSWRGSFIRLAVSLLSV